jgi:hypothetical protein
MFRLTIYVSETDQLIGGYWFTSEPFTLKESALKAAARIKPKVVRVILQKQNPKLTWDGNVQWDDIEEF